MPQEYIIDDIHIKMERKKFTVSNSFGSRWANEIFDTKKDAVNFCKQNKLPLIPSVVDVQKHGRVFLLYDDNIKNYCDDESVVGSHFSKLWTNKKFMTPNEVVKFMNANDLQYTLKSIDVLNDYKAIK